ncbi:hypothetical protein [Kitasatospora sp. NPDC091207]|uniref:hypothetical protein n=1 Tax=Kitasatospora sp. NPDC091207 TaxID=3364083 RepID=UPI0038121C66
MNDRSTPTFDVAVHQAGAGGGPGPEVAHGFLLSVQTVLVPQPPETLSNPWQRLVVRITQNPDPAPEPAGETINVAGLALSAVATDGVTAAAALLTLNKPSRHTDALREHSRRDLTAALHTHGGDLWAAYADLGYPIARPPALVAPDTWWLAFAGDLTDFTRAECCNTVPQQACCFK